MKISPISGDLLLKLALTGAALLVGLYLVRRLQDAWVPIEEWPRLILDAAADAVHETVLDARQTVADASPAAPGYQLPPGWYRVTVRGQTVITRYPDAMKTINPYDPLGLIDP